MSDMYILDGQTPIPEPDIMRWAEWFEAASANGGERRRVAGTDVGPTYVSTVFIGLNHQVLNGPPLLFETMIREGETFWTYQDRYSIWQEAEAGHARAIAYAQAQLAQREEPAE